MAATLLAVYAHPDDEVFGLGGTLSRYSEEGVHTVLVCATRGEVGEISDAALATPETLAEVRTRELECSAEMLGVKELIFLDYRDSGMEGTPENDDPRCFVQANADEVVAKLVRIIREKRPQVVLTFEPFGGYGHPDHIATYRHTTAAFEAAGDAAQYPEAGPAWQADRLFYSVSPMKFFREMREEMEAAGIDTSQMPNFEDEPRRWPDEKITTVIDVSPYGERKLKAAECHATQFGENSFFRKMPEKVQARLLANEHFAQALPDPAESPAPEADLFVGLAV
jgi:LmbE family N-acetylglucosaminyl deacetylase